MMRWETYCNEVRGRTHTVDKHGVVIHVSKTQTTTEHKAKATMKGKKP